MSFMKLSVAIVLSVLMCCVQVASADDYYVVPDTALPMSGNPAWDVDSCGEAYEGHLDALEDYEAPEDYEASSSFAAIVGRHSACLEACK